ncbi:MAG: pilus assembly protein PilM [Planctomycetota bacterium]
MARSCALRIGPRRFEIVVLDGSPKKHKITAYYAGDFELDPEVDEIQAKAAAIRDAARKHRIPKENISLVMSSESAAFRRLNVPFTDRAKIEQVLKFEVESDLPQFNIDDVVMDYCVLQERDGSAELLATAVPKVDVAKVITICEKAGIEPLEVELETTAIVNAAMSADLCHIGDAQVLVHIGEHATSVVVIDGGEPREMRVIHIGALSHEVVSADGDDAPESASDATDASDPIEQARRVDQAIKRIRRELGRTISGARTINTIEAVYVCGMELPGLVGSTILDVPVYVLDCFEADSGQPADGYGQLVAAYGGAFRQLGGGTLKPSLRREELRFTGTWERLEFPVALVALLAATFLGLVCIMQSREIASATYDGALYWLQSSNNYAVGNTKEGTGGRLKPPIKALRDRAKVYDVDLMAREPLPEGAADPIDELVDFDKALRNELLAVQREVGEIQDVAPPQSAFVAMAIVLDVLEDNDAAWRVAIRGVRSETQLPRAGKDEFVQVSLDLTFFAPDPVQANEHFAAFKRSLEAKPWCLGTEERTVDSIEEKGEGGGFGTQINGFPVSVDVNKYFQARS